MRCATFWAAWLLTALPCLSQAPDSRRNNQGPAAEFNAPPGTAAAVLSRQWSRDRATGRGPVRLTSFPLRASDISHINPMGMMASGHTTPCDHLYLVAKESPDKSRLYDVVAVADGYVVMIQWLSLIHICIRRFST